MNYFHLFLFCFLFSNINAQDSLLHKLIAQNAYTFKIESEGFSGEGWELIKEEVAKSDNVLIGEEHFTNEIPFFTKAVFDLKKFDNFFVEIDPYTTEIAQKIIQKKRVSPLIDKEVVPLLALKPEFELIKHVINAGTDLMGAEQIIMMLDQIILADLSELTNNEDARKIYKNIVKKSKADYHTFLSGIASNSPTAGMDTLYFMRPEFMDQINALEKLKLSEKEEEVIKQIKLSRQIYEGGGAKLRIKTFKNQLMNSSDKWAKADNLFKYGAVHMTRGESLVSLHDIGNLVANITDSNFEKSLHIMLMGESGELGAPIKGLPNSKKDREGWISKSLSPFYDYTTSGDWYLFDLRPLREKIERQQLTIDDYELFLIIKGYDALVIIPELTPAGFN